MPIIGRALRGEIAEAIGFKNLKNEVQQLARQLQKLTRLVEVLSGNESAHKETEVTPSTAPSAAEIRELRRRLGETQQGFAARMKVTRAMVIRWESGSSVPRKIAVLARLRRLLSGGSERAAAKRTAKRSEKKSVPLSSERRVMLKLQGQYMGHVRHLEPKNKARVKVLKTAKGYRPAIELAKKLLAVPSSTRAKARPRLTS